MDSGISKIDSPVDFSIHISSPNKAPPVDFWLLPFLFLALHSTQPWESERVVLVIQGNLPKSELIVVWRGNVCSSPNPTRTHHTCKPWRLTWLYTVQIDKCHADWGSCHAPIIIYPEGTKYPEISNSDKNPGRAELSFFFLCITIKAIRPLSCPSPSLSDHLVLCHSIEEMVALVIVVFSPKLLLLLLELTWQIPSTWISLLTDPSPETQDLTGTTTCLLFSPCSSQHRPIMHFAAWTPTIYFTQKVTGLDDVPKTKGNCKTNRNAADTVQLLSLRFSIDCRSTDHWMR